MAAATAPIPDLHEAARIETHAAFLAFKCHTGFTALTGTAATWPLTLHFTLFIPRPQLGPEAPDPHSFFTNGIKGSVTLCGSGQSPETAKQGFRIFKETEHI